MYYAGAVNNFVDVEFNQATSTITCVLSKELVDGPSNNTCIIEYASGENCDSLPTSGQTSWMVSDSMSIVIPRVLEPGVVYCFVVTANIDNFTVVLEGTLPISGNNNCIHIVP